MKQLSKLQDTDVTKVGKLIFVPEKKFQIARNGETEVLLGLWHDGTELAIKKMPLSQFNNVETALKKLKAELNSQNIVSYIDTARIATLATSPFSFVKTTWRNTKQLLNQ